MARQANPVVSLISFLDRLLFPPLPTASANSFWRTSSLVSASARFLFLFRTACRALGSTLAPLYRSRADVNIEVYCFSMPPLFPFFSQMAIASTSPTPERCVSPVSDARLPFSVRRFPDNLRVSLLFVEKYALLPTHEHGRHPSFRASKHRFSPGLFFTRPLKNRPDPSLENVSRLCRSESNVPL